MKISFIDMLRGEHISSKVHASVFGVLKTSNLPFLV